MTTRKFAATAMTHTEALEVFSTHCFCTIGANISTAGKKKKNKPISYSYYENDFYLIDHLKICFRDP